MNFPLSHRSLNMITSPLTCFAQRRNQAPLPVHLIRGTTNHLAKAVLSESRTLDDVRTEIT